MKFSFDLFGKILNIIFLNKFNFHSILYIFHVCEKTKNLISKNRLLQSNTSNEIEKCTEINHTIGNPDFLELNEINYDYITNHNKKVDLYLVKKDFELFFDRDFYPHFKSDLQNNLTIFPLKIYLLRWIEIFIERGRKISHIY